MIASRLQVVPFVDVTVLVSSLPSREQSGASLLAKDVERSLNRFLRDDIDEDVVDAVRREILEPLNSLMVMFLSSAQSAGAELRPLMMHHLRSQQDELASRLTNEHSLDALDWVVGLLRSFLLRVQDEVAPSAIAGIDRAELKRAIDSDPELNLYLRGTVALLGAGHAAKRALFEQAETLIDIAFLSLNQFFALMRKYGFAIEPFPFETKEEKRARFIRAVLRAQSALTIDEWRVIDGARSRLHAAHRHELILRVDEAAPRGR